MKIFGPLYDRVIQWSKHRHAERYLAALSFSESSFFPIPVDVMLAPMCLANLGKAWRYAFIAMLFSVIGGVAGYFIGYGAFESIRPWLADSSYWAAYETSRDWFERYGIWVVFVAGFSPIPYKVFTIAAGAAALNFPVFIVASALGRGARFFLVAGLLVWGGVQFEVSLRKYVERIGWITVGIVVAVIGWLMVRA
jgi:membrane protein YqaA with SNARE-associated domain